MGSFEWCRRSTDSGRLRFAGSFALETRALCTGVRQGSGAQTYERSKRRELGRVCRKDPDVVVIARFQTSNLDGSVPSTEFANLGRHILALLDTAYQVPSKGVPLIPFTSIVCFRDAA